MAFSLLAVQSKALESEHLHPLSSTAIFKGQQQHGIGTSKAYYLEEQRGNEGKEKKCL